MIEGRQPVREALRAGRRIYRIFVAQGAAPKGTLAEIMERARSAGVKIERVSRADLDAKATSRAHQGVIAEADETPNVSWRDSLEAARNRGETPLLLALDGIEDPQNLGAILRSAEIFGVHAVILPKHRSAPLSPIVRKVSAGAIEHLAIDIVTNMERTLAAAKEAGCWIVVLDADGDRSVEACDLLEEPVVIVSGAEGSGVSRLIKERADALVRIDTSGKVASLNASVATAICLWEAARRRK